MILFEFLCFLKSNNFHHFHFYISCLDLCKFEHSQKHMFSDERECSWSGILKESPEIRNVIIKDRIKTFVNFEKFVNNSILKSC